MFVNFDPSLIVQKCPVIQVAWCEQALIKTNRKLIQNHQSKKVLLFKTFTLEFDFDRHLEHMVSCQGMQSELLVFAFEIFMQNYCFAKPDFSYFSNCKHKKIYHICIEYDHILPFTNDKSTLLRFLFIYEA